MMPETDGEQAVLVAGLAFLAKLGYNVLVQAKRPETRTASSRCRRQPRAGNGLPSAG